MGKSPADIVEKAERLASSLTAGPVVVGKNVLLGLTADFLSEPRPDRERLRKTIELISEGNGGHLKRGGGYGDQVRTAVIELRRVLEEKDWSDPELKSLLGWTARLLLVRRAPGEQPSGGRVRAVSVPAREEPPPEPPKPVQKNVLRNVLLKLAQGSATAFRGDNPAAVCRPEDLDSELLKVLKRSRKGVRADVEVVKVGDSARIVSVAKWTEEK